MPTIFLRPITAAALCVAVSAAAALMAVDGPAWADTGAGADDDSFAIHGSDKAKGGGSGRERPGGSPRQNAGSQRVGSKDPATCDLGDGDLRGAGHDEGAQCLAPAPGDGGGPSVVTLSQEAREQLPIPGPMVHTAPPRGKKVLVHMPTWFWLDESQWGARSKTARAGDTWAKVTADARQLVIDPGDGSEPVYCEAPGLPYAEDAEEEDACTVTFDHSGTYTVRVTANWGADWAGSDGNGGDLPTIGRTASFQVTVVEARSELIDGT